MRHLSHDAMGRRMARITPSGTDTFFYDAVRGATVARRVPVWAERFPEALPIRLTRPGKALPDGRASGGALLATYRWSNPNQPELTPYFAGRKLEQYTDPLGNRGQTGDRRDVFLSVSEKRQSEGEQANSGGGLRVVGQFQIPKTGAGLAFMPYCVHA